MRWRNRTGSTNVEDRRGGGGGGLAIGGGLGTLVILGIALLLGVDPRALMESMPAESEAPPSGTYVGTPAEEEMKQFVSVVLADTETVWNQEFARVGRQYSEPNLVLFTGGVRSACGTASAAVGPFYCPADQKVYIDLSFYDDLKTRHGAPGDFAQAYVIAHEVGHHIQHQLGIAERVDAMRGRVSQSEYNELSVRLELQADYLAGVWAHHAQKTLGVIEAGDIEEALRAASAIGDDKLQMEGQGYVVPDSFTHGTSEQRMRWFRLGFQTGDMTKGDTFNARSL
jgi:predicted metalloprotease